MEYLFAYLLLVTAFLAVWCVVEVLFIAVTTIAKRVKK